jgi:RHS repeat-associated protein
VTVSDKKLAVDSDNDGVVNYYNADVVTASDYYPFGSQMPGRKYSQPNSSYRYGFNGKENDNSTGEGNLDFGSRVYDSRLGKFLSVDKYTHKQPFYSPFIFAGDKPIMCIDKDGNQEIIVTIYERQKDGTLLQMPTATYQTNIQTLEEARGITRSAYKITVVYEWVESSRQVNPQTVEHSQAKRLVSVTPDESSGLNRDEQKKFDSPFEWAIEKVMLAAASSYGALEMAKGMEDYQYGYGSEENGERITEGRARAYRIEGVAKFLTMAGGVAAKQGGKYFAMEALDFIVENSANSLTDWGLGNDEINKLAYSVIKLGVTLKGLKDPNKWINAYELAADLFDTGLKGEALVSELSKRGVNMAIDVVADRNAAANKVLAEAREQYSTNDTTPATVPEKGP